MFYASQKAGKTRTRFSRDAAPAARIIPATERFATSGGYPVGLDYGVCQARLYRIIVPVLVETSHAKTYVRHTHSIFFMA
ncbi:hypothetical protein [Burkholderia thailandensis]|uniref:hypothetical protein n=1 Tax=Burkholderia thailandensis TaxID=57975 RepID=UPI000AF4471E|nr:hypothetical protein [Burkholderia thailandensis]MCS6517341.1 hypothetical protein [Burkholderia thailandensis]QIO10493.1 hypothetical protein G9462_00035 [Burkholderia thailandensis]QRA12853.1 hypothetical protein JMY07_00565 [Burkholderia thailandensis]WRS65869.1 hypothetical protein U9S59_00500 [Burkholderia thailandensis]